MVITNNNYLQGYLVGIGKIHKDGTEEYKVLEKPVHNRIVQTGIEGLMQQDGDNTLPTSTTNYVYEIPMRLWVGENTGRRRCGVLHYSAWGNGNTQTTFQDTELENRVSNYSSTKKTGNLSNYYFNGTKRLAQDKFLLRVSHIHSAATAADTVKEIGWFQRINNSDVYKMFSRVVLDIPYEIAEGEQLITTYEIYLTLGGNTVIHIDDFLSLKDNEGNTLQADVKLAYGGDNLNNAQYNANPYFPHIGNNGVEVLDRGSTWFYSGNHITTPFSNYYSNNYGDYCHYVNPLYSTSLTKDFVTYQDVYGYQETEGKISQGGDQNAVSWKVKDYITGTNYRDIEYTIPNLWPNLTSLEAYADIRYLLINGYAYKFGYWETDSETGEQVWHSQAFRKYGNKIWKLTVRHSFSTEDTI